MLEDCSLDVGLWGLPVCVDSLEQHVHCIEHKLEGIYRSSSNCFA